MPLLDISPRGQPLAFVDQLFSFGLSLGSVLLISVDWFGRLPLVVMGVNQHGHGEMIMPWPAYTTYVVQAVSWKLHRLFEFGWDSSGGFLVSRVWMGVLIEAFGHSSFCKRSVVGNLMATFR